MRRAACVLITSVPLALATAPAGAQPALNGFYLGLFGGVMATDATVDVPPVGDRSQPMRAVDQGGDGFVVGGRGGWGRLVSRSVYLGLEGEGLYADVSSRFNTLGVRYKLDVTQEWAGYVRLGWSPDQTTLLFLRGGIAANRIERRLGAEKREGWYGTPIIGVGAEVAVNGRLAVRVDGTYSQPDAKDGLELFRGVIGLTFRF